jgi:subtilisin-like proprotein convertase family protein
MSFFVVLRQLRERWLGTSPRRGRRRPASVRSAGSLRQGRPQVEPLEERTLLSVLPAPAVTSQTPIGTVGVANSPQIAIDPANPQFMVTVYSTGSNLAASYSSNGGLTWLPFSLNVPILPDPVPVPPNAPSPWQVTNPTIAFDRTRAVDANGNVVANLESFYVAYVEHRQDNQAGDVMLEKFDFHTGFPIQQPLYNAQGNLTNSLVLYNWVQQELTNPQGLHSEPALNPVVVADSNLPPVIPNPVTGQPPVSFVDPVSGATQTDNLIVPLINDFVASFNDFDFGTGTQTATSFGNVITYRDPTTGVTGKVYQGAVYVAWNTNDALTTIPDPTPSTNPNTIRVVASDDGGQTFSSERFLLTDAGLANAFRSAERATAPTLVVPQGTSSDRQSGIVNGQAVGPVQGGQLTGVWDNFAINQILSNTVADGGSGALFTDTSPRSTESSGASNTITDAQPTPGGGPDTQEMSSFPLTVNITNPNFTTASDIQVGVNGFHPTDAEVEIRLLPAGPLDQPHGIVVNPVDGNLYVSSFGTNSVVEFNGGRSNPAKAGQLIRVFVPAQSGGLQGPDGLTFGPDDNGDGVRDLYVSSSLSGQVLVYDGNTGAFIGTYVAKGTGNLQQPMGLTFDAAGDLFVSDFANNDVVEYGPGSPAAGPIVRTFRGGLLGPDGVTIGPDGRLYVASGGNNSIISFDISTGGATPFAVGGHLNQPSGLIFGVDGDLYVSNAANNLSPDANEVIRLHGTQADGANPGTFLGVFVSNTPGINNRLIQAPRGLAFMLDATGQVNPTNNPLFVASSASAVSRILRFTGAPGAPLPGTTLFGQQEPGAVFVDTTGGLNNGQSMLFRGGFDNNAFLVANNAGNGVLRFDATTGRLLSNFVPGNNTNGLVAPTGMAFDSNNNTYIASAAGRVLQYTGQAGGVFVRNIVGQNSGGLVSPSGLAVNGSTDLFVADVAGNQILRYDLTNNGAPKPIGTFGGAIFVPSGLPGPAKLNKPIGLTLLTVNNQTVLLVANSGSNDILEFDLAGNFIKVFATNGVNGVPLLNPTYMSFNSIPSGGDDTVYVSSNGNNRILRFDTNGNYLESIVPLANDIVNNPGGLQGPTGLAVHNNHLYVISNQTNEVMRFNGTPANAMPSPLAPGNPGIVGPEGIRGGSPIFVELGGANPINLLTNHINESGQAVNGIFSGGSGFGVNSVVPYDLVFDQNAARGIDDATAQAPYAQHYRPESAGGFVPTPLPPAGAPALTGGLNVASIIGKDAGTLNGTWNLEIIDHRASSNPVQFLSSWYLQFTSRLDTVGVDRTVTNPGTATPANATEAGATIVVGGTTVNALPNAAQAGESPNRGTGATPVIAADSTLGSFSPNQGRLYVAYSSGGGDGTDIFLVTSDDGGQTWLRTPVRVNDDSPADNFSEGTRPQFDPSVAVDQTTGTLVLSFYDTRNDADRARPAMYVATSLNGGWLVDPPTGRVVPNFAPETYLNDSLHATDAITSNDVVLEPSPDNANGNSLFNFGDHQGLAVNHGLIYAAWASNNNLVIPGLQRMIVTGVQHTLPDGSLAGGATIAAGPRVVSSTMGPVDTGTALTDDGRTFLYNNTFAPDGTQQVNGFVVTFDRPVDPTTFGTGQVQVFYRDTNTPAGNPPTPVPVTEVIPLDGYTTRYGPAQVGGIDTKSPTILDPNTGTPFDVPLLATQFLVTFQPRSGTGTYSYSVGPNVADRVRSFFPTVGPAILPAHEQKNSTQAVIPPQDTGGDGGLLDPRDTTKSTITFKNVSSSELIKDVTVNLNIQHSFDSDLLIELIAPDGTTVVLSRNEGGGGQNFTNTTFSDSAPTPINAGPPGAVAPFTGSFQPETSFSTLFGKQVNGTWTLAIDDTAQGDTGRLLDWTLTLTTGQAVVTTQAGNQMDQNGNAIDAEPATTTTGADVYSTPTPVDDGPLFHPKYNSTTLPLIVPGPHIVSTFVPGNDSHGNPINPPTADNLVLNQAVHFIDVTFDRDMDPNFFTTGTGPKGGVAGSSALLQLVGPTGNIPLFDPNTGFALPGVSVIPDPFTNGTSFPNPPGVPSYPRLINGVLSTAQDPDTQHPRTFRITLPDQPGTPLGNGLDLSGSYTLSLAPLMRAELKGGQTQGDLLDTNLNAGLDLLRGTASDPTSASFATHSHAYGGPAVTIPGGKFQDIPITFGPEDFLIQKATVQLNIQAPFDPNLEAQLIAPNGKVVQLFTNVGNNGTRANFSNTLFDDTAKTPIQQGVAPFNSLVFGPFNPQTPLSVLNGLPSTGVWTLRITNDGAASPDATLVGWSLNLTEAVPGTGLGELHADAATVHFRIFTQDPANALSHTTWTAVGPASSTTAVTPATINQTNSTSVTHSFTGQAVPLTPNTTQDITLNFGPENFPIQKAVVTLNIQTPNVSTLTAILVSPNGTRVPLFTNIPNTGADFANTVFDDAGRSSIALGVTPAVAPFYTPLQGSFIPQVPLSTLLNQNSSGVWHLLVTNDPGAPSGTLTSWSLTLSQPTPSNSGRVTAMAVDPSDPSGNTVYVGGASGGIWKTTNFLAPGKLGPTWVPLTDFGPVAGINISSIAVFPRNNDPRQSIVFASTGDGDTGTAGVGILRSMDGGNTWTLLDSTNNVNSPAVGQGILTPINDAGRDHAFVGLTSYKIVVDPTHAPTSPDDVIVYAAMGGGANGGLWRSLDAGRHWQRMSATSGQPATGTEATDVVLAPATVSVSTGNLQNVYAAFRGVGVFLSTNQGTGLRLLAGGLGDPVIRDGDVSPAGTLGVTAPPATPNGPNGRIVLAVPPLAHNHIDPNTHQPDLVLNAQDPANLVYQGWVYAAVINPNGTFNGLYLTKDVGGNWTRIDLPQVTTPLGLGTPTNDETNPNHDTDGGTDRTSGFANNTGQTSVPGGNGNYAVSLAVDPNNPSVVYLGGLDNVGILKTPAPAGGLIRVDLTKLTDPHNFTAFDNNDNAGLVPNPAPFQSQTVGGLNLKAPGGAFKVLQQLPDGSGNVNVRVPFGSTPFLNLITDPNNPFLANATILVSGVNGFTNGGDESLFAPDIKMVGGPTGFEENGDLGVHSILGLVDPLTGKTRLLLGADQGVFSVVDQGNGNLIQSLGDTADLSSQSGDTAIVSGSRNGNLQIAQMLGGSSQPSVIAAEVAAAIRGSGGLFYGNTMNNGFPVSDPNVLDNGNIFWSGPLGTGTGITTDQTGTGTAYSFQWPGFGIFSQLATTNFFVVNPAGGGYSSRVGSASGASLVVGVNGNNLAPDTEWPFQAQFVPTGPNSPDAIVPNSRPAVNPIEGDQLVISSSTGRIFRSRDQGFTWSIIADPATLDSTYAPALAYGAADPNNPSHQLDDFIFAGTSGGKVFVTLDGGTTWNNISTGLDGSPVLSIQTNPIRGTHEAFAVTEKGVYHITFDVTYSASAPPTIINNTNWTPITGNLFTIPVVFSPSVFNSLVINAPHDPNQGGSAPEETRLTFLTSLAVDWRDITGTNKALFPPLYVGGDTGVYRSLDGGTTWTIFPSVAQDGARVDGGYLPMVQVMDLTLATGGLNPATSLPNQATGPNVLVATTYGRGQFAIRLPNNDAFNPVEGPQVTALNAKALGSTVTVPAGTTSVTVTFSNTVDPNTFNTIDEVVVLGPNGQLPVTSIVDVAPPGQVDQHTTYQINFAAANQQGNYTLVFGPGIGGLLGPRDYSGHQMDQNNNGINGEGGPFQPVLPTGDQFVGHFTVQGAVTSGLSVTSAVPDNLTSPPGLSSITITFGGTTTGVNLPAQASAVSVAGPGGPITGLTFTDVSSSAGMPAGTVWRINLPGAQVATGNYTVGVSATLQDQSGQSLQPASGFSATFTVSAQSGPPVPPVLPPPTVLGPGLVGFDQVAFLPGKMKKLKNGRFRQTVQAFNVGGASIPTPLALVVLMPRGVQLLNATGVSTVVVPGQPYQLQFLPGAVLNTFDGATFTLEFKSKKARKKFQPTYLLVAGLLRL